MIERECDDLDDAIETLKTKLPIIIWKVSEHERARNRNPDVDRANLLIAATQIADVFDAHDTAHIKNSAAS